MRDARKDAKGSASLAERRTATEWAKAGHCEMTELGQLRSS
jgi:hypothetical protein